MLVDEISLVFKGGNGGEGKVSFGPGKKSGPDGGNGGNGGRIYIVGSSDLTLLSQFTDDQVVSAESGESGDKKKQAGRKGEDLKIYLPVGTQIKDTHTGEIFEVEKVGQEIFLCHGGEGGIGNFELRSPRNTTPETAIPAKKGQVRPVKLTMRFIADYGLIGLPSSGKSSLLNELTNASVKTAEYHFTTLSPNLGVLPSKKILADIPGLIEGAHEGKGLGIKFLKHIQKVTLLLHCISVDSQNPLKDYQVVRNELKEFDEKLLDKNEVIILTKTDLVGERQVKTVKNELKELKVEIIPTSIYDAESIENLQKVL